MAKRSVKSGAAKPKAKISKAEKDALKAELESLKNSREYPELIGLIGTAPYKAIATLEWANQHLPAGIPPFEKFNKKEKESFAIALIRSGSATKIIDTLKDAPSRQWKTLFAELAGTSAKRAEEKVKSLKPKDFALFCQINDIPVVKTGAKQSLSKAKTLPSVMAKLDEMREYLKL